MFTTWASKMVFPSRIPVNISTHSSSERSSPVVSCSPSEHQESSSALRLILRETPEDESAAARGVSVCVFRTARAAVLVSLIVETDPSWVSTERCVMLLNGHTEALATYWLSVQLPACHTSRLSICPSHKWRYRRWKEHFCHCRNRTDEHLTAYFKVQ